MDYWTIRDIFDRAFNGATNFMTPVVIRYGKKGPYIYELSRGEEGDRLAGDIHGVTVLTTKGGPTRLNDSFDSREEAEAYIQSLADTAAEVVDQAHGGDA